MLGPVDILSGMNAFKGWIDAAMRSGAVGWLWFAPPLCRSGNRLWLRALELAWLAISCGIPFFLAHPKNSQAWRMREAQKLMSQGSVRSYEVHWCGYQNEGCQDLPRKKATRVLSSGSWFAKVVRTCPGDHEHGKPLSGSRAKAVGAYPWGFCRCFAAEVGSWYGEAAERRALDILQA